MPKVERTVFISYRRVDGSPWALAVFQHLEKHEFDVFIDIESLPSGDFEQMILESIKARAHFVVLLTPSCLDRANEPGDLFRREIETALKWRRNIVPLIFPGFSFSDSEATGKLTGDIAAFRKYNGISVDFEHFSTAMSRLRTVFLDVAIDTVLHPPLPSTAAAAAEHRTMARSLPQVSDNEFAAGLWFSLGCLANDPDRKVSFYTKAIELNAEYAGAFSNRALARLDLRDIQGAVTDLDEAIRLQPEFAGAYLNRGNVLKRLDLFDKALADFNEAIRLDPGYAAAYSNRGLVHVRTGKHHLAREDFDQAIQLVPDFSNAIYERARLKELHREYPGAIADYQHYLAVGGPHRQPDHDQILDTIQELRARVKG
jgi:hypothetical protein